MYFSEIYTIFFLDSLVHFLYPFKYEMSSDAHSVRALQQNGIHLLESQQYLITNT